MKKLLLISVSILILLFISCDPDSGIEDTPHVHELYITEAGAISCKTCSETVTKDFIAEVSGGKVSKYALLVSSDTDLGLTVDGSNITYTNQSGTAKNIVINSSEDHNLTINAPLDDVTHYGKARNINIIAVANNSYTGKAEVSESVSISQGSLKLEVPVSALKIEATGSVSVNLAADANVETVTIRKKEEAETLNIRIDGTGTVDKLETATPVTIATNITSVDVKSEDVSITLSGNAKVEEVKVDESVSFTEAKKFEIKVESSTATIESITGVDSSVLETKAAEGVTPAHIHVWDAGVETTKATCTENGVLTHSCSGCTEKKTEVIKALGHDLEHHDAKEPTCTEVGWDKYDSCRREGCTYTTYVEIPATGHSFSEEWSKDETNHWHASTCGHSEEVKDKSAHDFDNKGYCATCDYDKYIQSISVKTLPKKKYFGQTEEFSADGLVLTVQYTDGTEDITEGWTIESPDFTILGNKKVTVKYHGKTTTYEITVAENECRDHAWNEAGLSRKKTTHRAALLKYTCGLCGATKEEMVNDNPDLYTYDSEGYLVKEEIRYGWREITYSADRLSGSWTEYHKTYGAQEHGEYTFDSDGNVLTETFCNSDNELYETRTYEYDADGVPSKWYSYDADGTLSYAYELEYDNNGNKTSQTEFDASGVKLCKYEYDSDGNMTKQTIYNTDGSIRMWTVSEYDSNGNMTKQTAYNADGSFNMWAECEYDSNGNQIKQTAYNADGSINVWAEYEYDSNGNQMKMTRYSASGVKTLEYELNSDGNMTKRITYYADGSIKSLSEYDSNGNMTKQTTYNADGSIKSEVTY